MKLEIIGITLPHFFEEEAEIITDLLSSDAFDRFHIRKTDIDDSKNSLAFTRRLIEKIPHDLHSRLSLHDCHSLASEYSCGVHLNHRNPLKPSGFRGIVSRSCHTIEEISQPNSEDYLFLSPIFPSISKQGYNPSLSISSLKGKLRMNIYALGGVTPSHFEEISEAGFGGAVMLGIIWEEYKNGKLSNLINEIKCFNS